MNKKANVENDCAAAGYITGGLSENLRRQYLKAMDIQPWFDPTLVAPLSDVLSVHEDDVSLKEPGNLSRVDSDNVTLENHVNVRSEQSSSINAIEALSARIEQCELCELHTNRKQTISGEGDTAAKLFIVIDAPVNDSSAEQALFTLANKQMLQAMLQAIGFQLSSVYITSLVKCLPPEQRAPQTSEMICCDDYLSDQLKLIQPNAILVLGELASQQLLVSQKSLTDLRLRHHKYQGIPVYASYHPGELFDSSENKRKVWADLLQISKHMK